MFLVDNSMNVSALSLADLQAALMYDFTKSYDTDVHFGLATFSTHATCYPEFASGLKHYLTDSIEDFQAAVAVYVQPNTKLGCMSDLDTNPLLDTLIAISSPSAGWRDSAYKVVVVVSGAAFNDSRSDSLKSALIASNIVPLFVTSSSGLTAYGNLISSLGFGLVVNTSDDEDVFHVAKAQIDSAFATVWAPIVNDPQGFVSSKSSPSNATPWIKVKAGSQTNPLKNIDVIFMGWGKSTVIPHLNSVPTSADVLFQFYVGDNLHDVTLTMDVTDLDGDALTVLIENPPTEGTLYPSSTNRTKLVAQDHLLLADGASIPYMVYEPLQSFSGSDSFKASFFDGCGKSEIFTFTVQTKYTDDPPSASDFTVSIQEGASSDIDFFATSHASDRVQAYTALDYYLATAPSPILATVTNGPGNINPGEKINGGVLSLHLLAGFCCDDVTFQFYVVNKLGMASNVATITVQVIHLPATPLALPISPIYVAGESSIGITTFTANPQDSLTYYMLDFGTSGTYKFGGKTFVAPQPSGAIIAEAAHPDTFGLNTQTIDYTPSTSNTESTFEWYAEGTDNFAAPIYTTVKFVPNNPPVATAVPLVTLTNNMDENTAPVFTLAGTDPDASETSLQVVITEIPPIDQLKLYCGDSILVSTVPYTTASPVICFLAPVPALSGSFTARVVFHTFDTPGAVSPSMIVPCTVLDVNSDDTKPIAYSFSYNMGLGDNTGFLLVTNKDPLFTPVAYITSLPTIPDAYLFQYTGEEITTFPTRITDPLNRFKFRALQMGMFSFDFYGTNFMDTRQTSVMTASIVVASAIINVPPTVQDNYVSQNREQSSLNAPTVLSYTDPDTAATDIALNMAISWRDMGRFKTYVAIRDFDQNGILINSGLSMKASSVGNSRTELSQGSYYGPARGGLFYLSDGNGASNFARYNIYFYCGSCGATPNPPKVDSAQYYVYIGGSSVAITINVHDPDWLQVFELTVSVVSGKDGSFSDGVSPGFWDNTPFTFSNVYQDQKSYTTSYTFYYTPSSSFQPGRMILNVIAKDQADNYSPTSVITVDTLASVPAPPIATVPSDFNVPFMGTSSDFTLGSDNMQTGYTIAFTYLPTKCTVMLRSGGIASIVPVYPENTVFYIEADGAYGTDFFLFQVVNGQDSSTPVMGKITITVGNSAPTAHYLAANEPVNGRLQIQLFASDPDPVDSHSFYISSLPGGSAQLLQGNGQAISAPGLVTDASGIIYVSVPPNAGINAQFDFHAIDSSSVNSQTVTVSITIPAPSLPPFMYDVPAQMLQNETASFPLGVSDPQNDPLTVAIVQAPAALEGNLYSTDMQQITLTNRNLNSDASLTIKPAANSLLTPGDYVITYQAFNPSTFVASTFAKLTLTVLPVPPVPGGPPIFSGSTSYAIVQNTSANILFVATSSADKYGVEITAVSSGKLYHIDGTQQTEITQYPFLLNDTQLVKRAKYFPPAKSYGQNLAQISVRVKDENGVSDVTNISVSVYKRHVAPTLASSPVVYSNGTSAPWQWGDQLEVKAETCANVGVVISDPDSEVTNLAIVIFELPSFGQLRSFSDDGDILQFKSIVPADATGLVTMFYCPNQTVEDKNDSFTFAATDNDTFSEPQAVKFAVKHAAIVSTGDVPTDPPAPAPTPAPPTPAPTSASPTSPPTSASPTSPPTSASPTSPPTSASPTSAPNPVQKSHHHSRRPPKIIGGVIGGIAGVTIIGAAAAFFFVHKYVQKTVTASDALLL